MTFAATAFVRSVVRRQREIECIRQVLFFEKRQQLHVPGDVSSVHRR